MATDKRHIVHLRGGKLNPTTPDDLEELFDQLPANTALAIHFHGGLVPSQSALTHAADLREVFEGANCYPVFFVWESGALETIWNNLTDIYEERIFQRLVMRVLQFARAKVKSLHESNGRGGMRLELGSETEIHKELNAIREAGQAISDDLPELPTGFHLSNEELKQYEEVASGDNVLASEIAAIVNGYLEREQVELAAEGTRSARTRISSATLMSPDVLQAAAAEASPGARGLVTAKTILTLASKALVQVVGRLASGRDHGLYATVVEEVLRAFYLANIGKGLWNSMKQDTADAFGDDPEKHGGTRFLFELAKNWQAHGPRRIILVGHSAGAIYACNFIAAVDRQLPEDVRLDVVLLAPGVSFKKFDETLTHHGRRIANFRMFTMLDDHERADPLPSKTLPIYPASLLYLVSGILEDGPDFPLVGLNRFYQPALAQEFKAEDREMLERVQAFVAQGTNRAVWSPADLGDGLHSEEISHGRFDDFGTPTLNSVRHILANGF